MTHSWRSVLALAAAGLLTQVSVAPVRAQDSAPRAVQAKRISPALEAAKALPQADIRNLQSDLAWTGHYNGLIDGEAGERMVRGISAFQRSLNVSPSGILAARERTLLANAARQARDQVGWRIVTEPASGARLGIPTRLVPQVTTGSGVRRWTAPDGSIQIILAHRQEPSNTIVQLADLERREPQARKIDYSLVRPDFFILTGTREGRKFYVRGAMQGTQARIMTITYAPAMDAVMQPIVVAMSSAFEPFAVPAMAESPARKPVEYGSGIIVGRNGEVLTDRLLVNECRVITVPGFGNVDMIGDDRGTELALLRINGARKLAAVSFAGNAFSVSEIVGIADPERQDGGKAVSRIRTALQQGADSTMQLSPSPGAGYAGALAIDSAGAPAGMVKMRPVPSGPNAALVPADDVRRFLAARKVQVEAAGGGDPREAVVRVICLRK